jgi:hypothetical protein
LLRAAVIAVLVFLQLCLQPLVVASAWAQVMAFGPQWSPFTLDVPEDWEVEPYAIGVVLRPNPDDRRTLITCAVSRSGGQTARELAEQAIRALRQRDPFSEWTIAREEAGLVWVNAIERGLRKQWLFVAGEAFLMMTLEGDIARLSPVAATLRVSPALRALPGPS